MGIRKVGIIMNDEPFCWSLLEEAKGVQLAEKAIECVLEKTYPIR